ncbi:MAG: pectinesterase family protein, partial [Opitutaceae bacterium]
MAILPSVGRADPGDVSPRAPDVPDRTFSLDDFGAVPDGRTSDTGAFRRAIAAIRRAGGGRLVVPAGAYLTGPISLCDRCDLHLERGATIRFSDRPGDYRREGPRFNAQIAAQGRDDVMISGAGVIDGQGAAWWPAARAARDPVTGRQLTGRTTPRPPMILFTDCQRVQVSGVTLRDSPAWTFTLVGCRDVEVDAITIRNPADSPNTDGIDPKGCQRVLISRCLIDTGDDCIAAGGGSRFPEKDVLITDCVFLHGHGCSIGSGTTGGVRDLTVRRCSFDGTDTGIRLKSARDRGGLVEHLTYADLTMRGVGRALSINSHYEGTTTDVIVDPHEPPVPVTRTTPRWRDITIRNLTATGGTTDAGLIAGLPEMPVENLLLEHVRIEAPTGLRIAYARNLAFRDVRIDVRRGPPLIVDGTVSGLTQSGPAAAAGPRILSLSPAPGASGVCPDTPLRIEFDEPVRLARKGLIRLYDAAGGRLIETIDLAARAPTKEVGGLAGFHYRPVIVSGSEAAIYPRNGELAYGRGYYVTADAGCFEGEGGRSRAIAGARSWRFSTRGSGPPRGASRITVAADGSGDFCTVQGALDFIPKGNTAPVTVFIRKGTYTELVHLADRDQVTLLGEDRAQTVIAYANNAVFNPEGHPYRRGVFLAERSPGLVLARLTVRNTTPQGGSQAEAVILGGGPRARSMLLDLDLYSHQDTLQVDGPAYVKNCRIVGDVDFMWGTGPCFFDRCDCVALRSGSYYTQVRNRASSHGFVFEHCAFEGLRGVMGGYLSRIQPGRFPHSEVVLLNCVLGDSVGVEGWRLQGPGPTGSLRFWEYASRALDGAPADVRWRAAPSRRLNGFADARAVANYSAPAFVLGGWNPEPERLAPATPDRRGVPPRILGPASRLALLGARPFLSVAATGPGPFSYQWLKDGEPLAGATSPVLRIGPAGWSDAGSYEVTVADAAGSVTSAPALLTVVAPDTPRPPELPSIPCAVFPAPRYGATPGSPDNAPAIQRAIAAASAAGGGIVELPAASGPYRSGPIELASRIELEIDPGATLQMLPYGTYPLRGPVYPTFIAAHRAHDLAVVGGGVIDGRGGLWWKAFRANRRMPHRPFLIRLDHCKAVLLSGLTLVDSPMFHAALNAVDQLTVFDLKV